MAADDSFESFIDDLSLAWGVAPGLAFLTGLLEARLAGRLSREQAPYVARPGAGRALRHSAYSSGDIVPGSDFARAAGGSPR